ncbi:hypothetical protein ACIQV3_10590 [Streptomyces sp. NPDC099050]|uniref:hypothetical protein n=1 Tax=Streptomyces sp. NPDC099050 TaxID=3366100 RepID=UPI00382A2F71
MVPMTPVRGPHVLAALEPADLEVVLDEPHLDLLDVLPEGDQLAALLAGRLDQDVQHRYDGLAEHVGDAVVDPFVEPVPTGAVDKVVHRACADLGLGVEEVRTHLTCDFAVSEQHARIQHRPSGPQGDGRGAGVEPTDLLKGGQFWTCQNLITVDREFVSVIDHHRFEGLNTDLEIGRHHRRRDMQPVRQQ